MINGESVKAGSFVEVENGIATLLIGSDKAKVAQEPEPAPACPPKPAPANPPQTPSSRRGRTKTTSGDD